MKQKMLLVAFAATILTTVGCAKQETVRSQQEDAVAFKTLTDGALRGTPITSANITTAASEFKVWGYLNATPTTEYVPGVVIKHNGASWEYKTASDQAYWPSGALDFYAVSPAEKTGLTTDITATAKKLTYVVPDHNGENNQGQIDLLYAVDMNRSKIDRVPLKFKHALSQIVFKGQTISNTLKVDVEKITIANVKGTGTFTLPSETTVAGSTAGTWELAASADADQKYTNPTKTTQVTNAAAVDLTPADGAFLVLPQTLTKWTTVPGTAVSIATADASHHSYLEISLKIQQSDVYLVGNANDYGTVYVPFGGEAWEPGKKYIYTLKFGGGYDNLGVPILQPILYDCSVEEWTAGSSADINL